MLHDGNRVFDDARSEESIQLIRNMLCKLHDDGDENSLMCRFNQILRRVKDYEVSAEATWNSYVKAVNRKLPGNLVHVFAGHHGKLIKREEGESMQDFIMRANKESPNGDIWITPHWC